MISGVSAVRMQRKDLDDGSDRAVACHNGYAGKFGLLHEREITMDATGARITGRDSLLPASQQPGAGVGLTAVARFHIHPAIDLVQVDDETILMRAPDGESWYLHIPDQRPHITEDVFFADASGIRASEQIEVEYFVASSPHLHWFLTRRS